MNARNLVAAVMTCAIAAGLRPAIAQDTGIISPGHLIYDEAGTRLLMLGAHRISERPEHLQLWEWKDRQWRALETGPGPAMRTLSGAVYDSRRKRIVLFGGLGNEGLADPRSDTWEWDGRRWMEMSASTMGSRDHHGMVFDERRGKTVMFGGVSSVTTPQGTGREFPADTWEWDGRRWNRVNVSGPSPRGGAGMVYDRAREVVVLFGGIGLTPGAPTRFNDTWTWNGKTWREVSNDGPTARNGQAMAFERETNTVVMWGGTAGSSHLDDMWRWDGTRWTQVSIDGASPASRTGAAMIYDTARQMLVFFGGRLRQGGRVVTSNEMWEWQRSRWSLVQPDR